MAVTHRTEHVGLDPDSLPTHLLERIVDNLHNGRAALAERVLKSPDPFASENPAKSSASLHDTVGINNMFLNIFEGELERRRNSG
jgi:hypothetical protein